MAVEQKGTTVETVNERALIIGGGIAGPVAAMFLKRAGIEAEIYEARSKDDSYIGSFLNLAGNGIEVLKTLGIDGAVTAVGSPVPRMVMWNGKGKRLGEVRNGARSGLTKSVTLRRGDLQRVLHDAAFDQGILAKCLRDIPNRQQAFATYECLRRERVERIVQWARTLGDNKAAANPFQAWFRDLMLPFFLKFSANPSKLDWIYAYQLDWNQPVRRLT